MRKPLFIYSSSNYCHAVEQQIPSLKPILLKACGKKIRRIDRLTQLALIGSFHCKATIELPARTGLYMSSIYGSLNNMAGVLSEIYQDGEFPRPLNFIHAVSNTACFYLADQLGLLANNQFVSRDHFTLEAGLKLASLDLELGNVEAAMVGLVCEVGENLGIHRQRFHIDPSIALGEGSHWLYLAHHLGNQQAIAKITHIEEPIRNGELQPFLRSLLHSVLNDLPTPTTIGFSDSIDNDQRQRLLQNMDIPMADYTPQKLHHEFSSALNIGGFLETVKLDTSAKRFIHLDQDNHQRWSVIVIESQCHPA